MDRSRTLPRRRGDRGASGVEYGLLVAGVAGLIVAVVFAFGHTVHDQNSDSCGKITHYLASGQAC